MTDTIETRVTQYEVTVRRGECALRRMVNAAPSDHLTAAVAAILSDLLTVSEVARAGCDREHDHAAVPFCARMVAGKLVKWRSETYREPVRQWTEEEQDEAGLDL